MSDQDQSKQPEQTPMMNEKAEEKQHEKMDEKRFEEKARRDPLSSMVWAGILIWVGVSLLANNLGILDNIPFLNQFEPWSLAFAGAGVIVLLEVLIRLTVPEYSGPAVRVREHQKTVVNLRDPHPEQVATTLVSPKAIYLCFVKQAGSPQTHIAKLSANEVIPLLANNTVYWDESAQLINNSNTLNNLIRVANLYQLSIGSDVAGIIAAIDELT